jgi:hypothetical protein
MTKIEGVGTRAVKGIGMDGDEGMERDRDGF